MAHGNGLEMFDLIKQIGKGSYGEVTLARHKRDKKQYVLKKINLKKASKRERSSAEQEAKLLSKLKHPNIVSYKDSFEKDGTLFIAMQYCEGGDLYNKLKENKGQALEERQVVEWFVQIAMALQYMHERNILHRDLKTQNIFLTKSKIIKVGDLGIARVLDSSSDMATTLIGTPYYMSPELFSNKPYNHKSDVWALGCCVYEMATLKHAFNAKDMNSLVYKILRGKMPPMPKQYTPELLQIIKNMLHQDPEKRPTVNRILRDSYIKKNISIFLEETKKSRPSSANKPSSAARVRPTSSRSSASHSDRSHHPRPPPAPSAPSSQDIVDGGKEKVSVFHVNANSNRDQEPPPSEPQPTPVILRKPTHARKPSDGAKQDLPPIAEDKAVAHSDKKLDSSSGSDQDTVKAKSLKEKEKPSSPKKNNASSPRKKKKESWISKKNSRGDGERSEADSAANVDSAASGTNSNHKKSIFKNHAATDAEPRHFSHDRSPKPVDKPRPLPPPPQVEESEGLPQHRQVSSQDKYSAIESKSSSTSSSREDASWDAETPRSLPNVSARMRRRNNASSSMERPQSARQVKLKRPESQRLTKAERSEHEPVRTKSKPNKIRQPSIQDDSSSSEEETLKENEDFKRDKEKLRENKEMNNFISLLDTTLNLNKEDDKSDEESPESRMVEEEEEKAPSPVASPDIHRSASLPSVETLCSANRLSQRIQLLHKDCVSGVGFETLHKAYQILSNIEDDEVEPQLVTLMGKENFDLYAGKIWQLKFCEECLLQLPSLQS
ncbi:serine/threonine-protein kinase Nek4-like isoform X2 [Mizuhopecten yessoensis]|uniref:serine/threonine-protein kinase Nek4-like isoform X2 n=1 Tax=Mizuhopecten yessoensis TaxID=6573 RepID=UPI000B45953F|nr:serine/threonine-protein kinase Nek4-like isoform X2 [Mizuhopecten yessoensis]